MDDDVTRRALERISVAPPYFDLHDLRASGDGIVTATVPHTPATEPEVGAMEAAQVARHLAILGSCAAALSRDDDKRHHYLATRAHYSRMSHSVVGPGETLTAEAVASWVDRRSARALIKLCTASGRALNLLDVEYTVLAPKMFARLNPPIQDPPIADGDGSDGDGGSHGSGELGFDVTDIAGGIEVACGPIPAALCAGHFPDYPAAPVAILMGHLCRAAGIGMVRHLERDDHRYRIEEGHVVAAGLARAGQDLRLRATYDQPIRGGHRMIGAAEADGEVVGEVVVSMSAHCPIIEPDEDEGDDDLDGYADDVGLAAVGAATGSVDSDGPGEAALRC